MANTNIPTSLITSTQIPVDGKTYKNTLSDIQLVTAELAYTYYAGMRITIASNNKQYVWKQLSAGETPISNTYTYPNGHIVEGYDYSNKTFAFYEVIVNSTPGPDPEPDNRIIYRTDVDSIEYGGGTTLLETYASIMHSRWTDTTSTSDGYRTEHFRLRPIASTSLRISLHDAQGGENEKPLWIDYYPDNALPICPTCHITSIEDAISQGENNLIVLPTEQPVLFPTEPIKGDVVIKFPGDVIIKNPNPGSPIFENVKKKQKFEILNGAKVTLESPLVVGSQAGDFKISGKGDLIYKNATSPLITTSNVGQMDGKPFKVDIQDVSFNLENSSLAKFNQGSEVVISNTKLDSISNTVPLIETASSTLNISNADWKVQNQPAAALFVAKETSSLNIDNLKLKGVVDSVIKVSPGNLETSPLVSINNSNLDSLTTNSLFSGIDSNVGVYAANLKVNNTLVINDDVMTNNPEGVKSTNTVVDGTIPDSGGSDVTKAYVDAADNALDVKITNVKDEQTALEVRVTTLESNTGFTLQRFANREVAKAALPLDTLFINTKNDIEDKTQWFVDVTV